jgi:hypothetical protein
VNQIIALIAAAIVLGAAAVLLIRNGSRAGPSGLAALAGVAAGVAAAVVFLVPEVDLLPDQFDGGVQLVVFLVSGLAIAALGWRRRRAG